MSVHVTPHMWAAGAIAVLVIAVTVSPITSSGGDFPVTNTDPRIAKPMADVVPAERALAPMAGSVTDMPTESPFTLRKTGSVRGPRIGLPPPPPLDVPSPPLLPMVEASK